MNLAVVELLNRIARIRTWDVRVSLQSDQVGALKDQTTNGARTKKYPQKENTHIHSQSLRLNSMHVILDQDSDGQSRTGLLRRRPANGHGWLPLDTDPLRQLVRVDHNACTTCGRNKFHMQRNRHQAHDNIENGIISSLNSAHTERRL